MNQNSLIPTETTIVTIPWNLDDRRLDVAAQIVTEAWFSPTLPRSAIQDAIKHGTILLHGSVVSPSVRVSKGDKICFTENFFQGIVKKEERVFPEGDEPYVLAQNEWFIAVYKPEFWLTHAVSGYQTEASLEDWLLKKNLIPAHIPNNGRVHRLDRNTSGIILYAKTPEVQEELKSLFQARKITKTYVALVEGHFEELSGTIREPMIRKKGSFKRIIAEEANEEEAKEAETSYRVLARSGEHDLLLVTPKTGRTHQIRVHMEHLGHPLAGDTLYGGKKTLLWRQFLHAFTLNFHFHGEKYTFQAPLAKDLKNVLLSLDERTLTRYDNEALQSMGLKPANAFFSLFKGIYSKNR